MPIYKMQGKKNGLQKYRVRYNYTDANGNHKQVEKVCYGKDEAKALEAQLQSQDHATIRLTDLQRQYLEHLKISVRETSYNNVEKHLRLYIMPYFENTKLSDLTTTKLLRWKTTLAETGLAVKTLQNIYTSFAAMLNWAVKMEMIKSSPLKRVGNYREPNFKTPEQRIHFYTPEQYMRFSACALADAEKIHFLGYYTFFAIAFYAGLRKGEINALRWDDIVNDTIKVRRSISQKIKGSELETAPKTKSSVRDVKIPEPLKKVLEAALDEQQHDPYYKSSYRVCGGIKTLADSTIDIKNRQYAAEAGLPHIKVHDFRHSHASVLANAGINIQEIARRLGHSDVQTTWNIYAHLYPKEEERAIAVLNQIK